MSSYYEAQRQGEEATEVGCGCLALLLQCGAITWILSSHFEILKATMIASVMTVMTWILAFMGIIPVLGQWLYGQFAKGVITWVFGLLQVDPNITLSVPDWINFILKWLLGAEEITGSLTSYTYGIGYTLSLLVSLSVFGGIVLLIVRQVILQRSQSA